MKLFAGQVKVAPAAARDFRESLALKRVTLGHYDQARAAFTDVLVDDAGRAFVHEAIALLDFGAVELQEIAEVASAGSSRRGSHRLGTWNTCAQSYAYRHVLKLVPLREPAGRALGALLHIGLMNFYLQRMGKEFVDPFEAMRDAPARIAYRFPDAKRILEAYLEHYKSEVLDVLDVEREFVVKVGGHWHTQRLDLIVRRGSFAEIMDHKCLPATAMITTRQGRFALGDLVDAGKAFDAAAWDEKKQTISWKRAEAPRPAGIQDVYSVRLKSGRLTLLGHRHPMLTKRGWVQAVDLQPGDEIAVAMSTPDRADAPVSDAMLWAVSSLICDGGYASAGCTYTKTDPMKRKLFKDAIDELAPDAWKESFSSRKPPYIGVRFAAWKALESFGLKRALSVDKTLPAACFTLSRRQVGVVVGALWEGDGCVSTVRDGRYNKNKLRIVYVSRSEQLCVDIQVLLTQLGLPTTVTESSVLYRGERRPYFMTTVVGRGGKRKFLDMIERGEIKAPVLAQKLGPFRAALESWKVQCDDIATDGAVQWDPVISSLFAGRLPCFDVTVPGPATFVADDLVTHNSAGYRSVNVAREWETSVQFMSAELIGHALFKSIYNLDFGGVVINSLGTTSTPEFSRHRLSIPGELLPFARQTIKRTNEEIEAEFTAGTDLWNFKRTWACQGRYGICDYDSLCRRGKAALGEYDQVEDQAAEMMK